MLKVLPCPCLPQAFILVFKRGITLNGIRKAKGQFFGLIIYLLFKFESRQLQYVPFDETSH